MSTFVLRVMQDGGRRQMIFDTLIRLCEKFHIRSLIEEQFDCIHQFLSGRNVFENNAIESTKS
jgi:hypothetical protein